MVLRGAPERLYGVASDLDVGLGVHPADVEDATQEALVEAWQRASTLPVGQDEAQHEMFRIAAKMAQRSRRHAARLVCVNELELTDPHDTEAWIAARRLWLTALVRLDEPERLLIISRHIDGRTFKDIGAEMGKEEETARQRVKVAEKKLQAELDKLMGRDDKAKRGAAAMGLGFTLDPFDRAVFRAILDVEEEFGLAPPPASTVRPKVAAKPWPWQYFPMGILAITLFLVPGQGWRTEVLYAEKIGSIPLPTVQVRTATRTPEENHSPVEPSLPRKPVVNPARTVPRLSDKGVAIVNSLRKTPSALSSP
jgi:RNA polymerase sigma factor (sigma-70 family)